MAKEGLNHIPSAKEKSTFFNSILVTNVNPNI